MEEAGINTRESIENKWMDAAGIALLLITSRSSYSIYKQTKFV
jgi:hypothetical protein